MRASDLAVPGQLSLDIATTSHRTCYIGTREETTCKDDPFSGNFAPHLSRAKTRCTPCTVLICFPASRVPDRMTSNGDANRVDVVGIQQKGFATAVTDTMAFSISQS